MGAKIIGLVVLVLLIVGGIYAYQHYNEAKTAESGSFQCKGCLSPEEEARFKEKNSGNTPDGQSEHKDETARQAAIDTTHGSDPASTPVQPATPAAAQPNMSQQNMGQTTMATQPAPDQANPAYTRTAPAAGMPMADSQTANNPNGMRFAGSGSYQWYRQGSLTWRVNTSSGQSCIIYATMEEWRKQIVASHGCGRDA